MQGIQKPLQVRLVIASQIAKCIRKGCHIFTILVGYADSKEKSSTLENILAIQNFPNVFPKEILGLLPKRDRFYN